MFNIEITYGYHIPLLGKVLNLSPIVLRYVLAIGCLNCLLVVAIMGFSDIRSNALMYTSFFVV